MATEWLHAQALDARATLSLGQIEAVDRYADGIAGSTIAMAQALRLERPYFAPHVLVNLLSRLVVADVEAAQTMPEQLRSFYEEEAARELAGNYASTMLAAHTGARETNQRNPVAGEHFHAAMAGSAMLHNVIFMSGHFPGFSPGYVHPLLRFQQGYCGNILGEMVDAQQQLPTPEEMSAWWNLPSLPE